MWRELLGDNGDGGGLAAVSMGLIGMEDWEASIRAAARARSALKFGEDGACREVAPSAQQRERKKWIMLESREVLLVCSKMATRWALGSWKVMEGSGGGRWMRDKLSRASGEMGPMLEIGI